MDEQRNLDGRDIADRIEKRFDEYKRFAFKDDMFRLAVAFIMGTAFTKVVNSISDNLLMPLLTFITSQTGSTWKTATWMPIAGLKFEIGKFTGSLVEFLLISSTLFVITKIIAAYLFKEKNDGRSV